VRFDLKCPTQRRRAEQDLLWSDHGFLRAVFQNADQVAEGVWRSNQPSPAQLETWKARGIRTVINLRGDSDASFNVLEKDACARLGLDLVFLQTRSRAAPCKSLLQTARKTFETIAYPALIHCKSGADRAGMMSVFYSHVIAGEPLDKALRHLSLRYLHLNTGPTGILDHFWQSWAQAKAEGWSDFWTWVDRAYCPDALKAGFIPKPVGAWITDRVLRSE
jgi:protein tyrosine/serine phosphatase